MKRMPNAEQTESASDKLALKHQASDCNFSANIKHICNIVHSFLPIQDAMGDYLVLESSIR